MDPGTYGSMDTMFALERRSFLKAGGALGLALVLGSPSLWAAEETKKDKPAPIETNIAEAMKVPRASCAIPGPFPGKVVEVHDERAMAAGGPDAAVVKRMVERGLRQLAGEGSWARFFTPSDVVGLKVNPVGAGLISTRLEVVDAVIDWLTAGGLKKENIIIWDRFAHMLSDAGFTPERFPGVGIEALQTMLTGDGEGKAPLDGKGEHVSAGNFDRDAYYWADVEGQPDGAYLNQHVFNGRFSYFGKLLTKKLTKIINRAVFKNTGNGISMATKNLGYGAVCNTNRLHKPLFFKVCAEVLAFPPVRDKLVLNIVDGLRAQYDGGPMPAAKYTYLYNRLFFATDPIALDATCHRLMVEKRKSAGIKVNEHPVFTDYLRYAEKLGLGIAAFERIDHARVEMA